mmetsp:Transcript_26225/g.67448  ORF Transcript_26225/g.67448 Transcript_26225/m.67448 type:complete len:100 (+) Transcript_26225:1223-1522(+)
MGVIQQGKGFAAHPFRAHCLLLYRLGRFVALLVALLRHPKDVFDVRHRTPPPSQSGKDARTRESGTSQRQTAPASTQEHTTAHHCHNPWGPLPVLEPLF